MITENKNILFYAHYFNGLGDISSAFKIGNALHECLNIAKENLFCGTNEEQKAAIFNKNQFTILAPRASFFGPPSLTTYFAEMQKVHQFAFQVIPAPSINEAASLFFATRVPSLVLYEYGFKNHPFHPAFKNFVTTKSLGLNEKEGEIGILIDSELYEWGFSKEAQISLKRIEQLQFVNSSLREAILENEDFVSFDAQSLLYVGYTNQFTSSVKFIKDLSDLNTYDSSNQKNLTFILPGNFSTQFQSCVELTDIPSLVIKEVNRNGTIKEVMRRKGKEGEKTLTIFTGSINHVDFKHLLKASEKETVVTGDQSLSEAISLNKVFMYEALNHKHKFANDIQTTYSTNSQFDVQVTFFNAHSANMRKFFEKNRQDNYQHFFKVNKIICEKHNAFTQIIKLIEEKKLSASNSVLPQIVSNSDPFDYEKMPFDQPIIFELDHLLNLKIKTEDSKSTLKIFNDSIFDYSSLGSGFYVVTRQHDLNIIN
jgi:hypothetical protein